MTQSRIDGPPNPFEVYLLLAGFLTGAGFFVGLVRPTSIEETLPPEFRLVWAALLVFGGGIALLGMFWPGRRLTAILVKRVGLIMAGFGSLAYGVAVALLFASAGAATAVYNVAFSVACFWRAVQVSLIIRTVMSRLREVDQARGD